jgi:hypothetical protein
VARPPWRSLPPLRRPRWRAAGEQLMGKMGACGVRQGGPAGDTRGIRPQARRSRETRLAGARAGHGEVGRRPRQSREMRGAASRGLGGAGRHASPEKGSGHFEGRGEAGCRPRRSKRGTRGSRLQASSEQGDTRGRSRPRQLMDSQLVEPCRQIVN